MQIRTPCPANIPLSITQEKCKLKELHDENCSCCCCCPSVCYKYVQPDVPQSFAPVRRYWKSNIPMDDNTTYGLSYWGCPVPQTDPIPPRNSLTTSNCEMTDKTTYNTSYFDYVCAKPAQSITPCEKQWLGRGPMQDVTTQKHDYTWKRTEVAKPFRAVNNIFCHTAPLAEDTTYRLSYYESCGGPPESYAPIRKYIKSGIPFEKHTVYKLSYWPCNTVRDEPYSPKYEYLPPAYPIDCCTTYKLSYYPHDGKRPSPIIHMPDENLLNRGCCSDSNTIYRLSYFGCENAKRDPIVPPGRITFSTCPPAYDTIHRMSFLGNWDVKPEVAITPCDRQMLGRGLMQDVTTQKHDYTWKRTELEPPVLPRDHLMSSCAPLSHCTTHRMSYLPNEDSTPVESCAPIRVYKPSCIPMERETVMNLSYQPATGADPVMKITANVPYQTPSIPLEGHTTYNTSYIPPGTMVPCYMENSGPCQPQAQCCS